MAAIIAQKKLFKWSTAEIFVSPIHRPSPHDLGGEEIRYFLQTEQDTANRCTERNCNAGGGSRTQDLASFAWTLAIRSHSIGYTLVAKELTFICLVLDKETTNDVSDAACDVDEWTLLA